MKKIISTLLIITMLVANIIAYANTTEYEVIDGWQYIKGTNIITSYVGTDADVTIPENTVLKYPWRFFNGSIKKLTISKNVVIYNDYSHFFAHDNSPDAVIEEVVFAEGVTEVPQYAFMDYSTLKKVTLPSTLKTIGDYAFGYDEGSEPLEIEELRLPASLEDVPGTAFLNRKIKKIYVEEGYKADSIPYADEYEIEKMSADIFNCIAGDEWTENVYLKGLTDLDMGDYVDDGFVILDNVLLRYIGTNRKPVIPSNVTRIAKYAFRYCDIETAVLTENIEILTALSFANSTLEYIEIPSSIKELKSACLARTNLKEIFIPKTVKKIHPTFTSGCRQLEKVTFEGVPDIGDGAGFFYSCDSLEREGVIFLDDRMVVPEDFWEFCMYRVKPTQTPTPTASPVPTATPIPTPTPTPTASPTPTATPTPTVTPTPSPTTEPEKVIEVTSGNNIEVRADGEKVKFTDANPFIDENNRTQMPIRVLGETLGFDVKWDDTTKTATLQSSGTLITVKIGESKILKNQEIIQMDTVAKIINDRTYIPLRAIAEAVGYTVKWN